MLCGMAVEMTDTEFIQIRNALVQSLCCVDGKEVCRAASHTREISSAVDLVMEIDRREGAARHG